METYEELALEVNKRAFVLTETLTNFQEEMIERIRLAQQNEMTALLGKMNARLTAIEAKLAEHAEDHGD